jgi:uncharacterized repeat protein (TIGR03803 family)
MISMKYLGQHNLRIRWRRIKTIIGKCVLVAAILAARSTLAQNYKVLYSFTGGADGGQPMAGLISDAAGNLYGTTQSGGILTGPCSPQGCGVVFKLDPTGNETVLHRFTGGADGASPNAALVQDAGGNLYGTTGSGGVCSWPFSSNGCGVVFKLDPTTGQETVLYSFTGGADGAAPGPLLLDNAGILYGTTSLGGGDASGRCQAIGCGVVFKLDPSTSNYTVLYTFTGAADGGQPSAGLVQDSAGNFYGTTSSGGANVSVCGGFGCGVVFKLDPAGTDTVLYTFKGQADGGTPVAALIWDTHGDLYGTTENAGTYGWGVVFKLDATGTETVLHEFTGGADGATPRGGLISDAAGNLYGTTLQGGTGTFFTNGVVFELDSSGTYIVLHTLAASGAEGINPYAGLLMNSVGNLYGTASAGGPSCPANAFSCGVVFEVTSGAVTTFNVSVALAGNGNGTVTSNPAGINCGSTCSANFANGTTVTLSASPATGSAFEGWSGSCSGTGNCPLAAGAEVTAIFNQSPSDFSLTPASASIALRPGGQGTDVITIAPQNNAFFGNAIQLSCAVTGSAPAPTCTLSPSSVTPGANSATSTLTVTAPTSSVASSSSRFQQLIPSLYALWFPLVFGATLFVAPTKQKRPLRFLSGFLLLLFLLQTACGGNGGGRSANYTVTITGTSNTLQHSAQVRVTVTAQ